MRIRILADTVCDGSVVKSGAVIDARPDSAAFLIRLGKAIAEKPVGDVPVDTDRSVGREHIARRRKSP